MNSENLYTAGLVAVVVIIMYVLLQKRKVNTVMASNNEVVPLMMQKATQMKVVRLQQATNDTPANDELQQLVASYKANRIGIKEYNDRLDRMLSSLNVEI